jgi:hypothetical protein
MKKTYDENLVYYVYHLVNPVTNFPFYVGKGKNNRCRQHLIDTPERAQNKRLNGHIRKIRERGIEPIIIKYQENMTEEAAYTLEEKQILEYGRIGYEDGGILMNILLDSKPPVRYGQDNGFYGRTHSEETKRIIGEKNRGSKHTEESKEKIRQRHKGVPKSEEHRKKIGEKSKGRSPSQETREKLMQHNLKEDVLRHNIECKQKEYIVTTPDGEEIEVINLSDFCKDTNLDRCKMYSVASGDRKTHKGYKCRKK